MFEWWFRHCDDDATYQLWHPLDHEEGHWSPDYYKKARGERGPGHHIGQSHIVKERVGGQLTHLHIDFKDPSEYLDASRFKVRRRR